MTTNAYKCKFCDFVIIKHDGNWIIDNPVRHCNERHKSKFTASQAIRSFTKLREG